MPNDHATPTAKTAVLLSDLPPGSAIAALARFKEATGGARWDSTRSLREYGTIGVGGMSGDYEAVRDLRDGRSTSRHTLGSLQGAAGYDGVAAWQRGPGGEIVVLDAPEAKRRARSQAWLDARAYWYPERGAAIHGEVMLRAVDDRVYRLIEVVPEGGDPLTLWIDDASQCLVRIVRRRGADCVTTWFDDWRDVDGRLLPFVTLTERAGANEHVDPRQTMRITLERITVDGVIDDVEFSAPTMDGVARIDEGQATTVIPFELINNHIHVDGEIDGQRVRFMVDTGGMNLLTPAAAHRLGLIGEGRLSASGPGERRMDVALARAASVRVGSASLDNPVFHLIDLGDLPAVEGVDFDGLIGYEMFRRFGVHIDYAGRKLTLTEPAAFVPPAGIAAIDFEFDRLTPIVAGVLDGLSVRLTVDTGSRAALTVTAPFVATHDLATKYDAAPESVLGWGVGGATRLRPARFGRLRLGDLDIDGIAGDLFVGTTGALTNPDQSGNLGGGVLRRFTVSFDYAHRRMYLAPNADFNEPDLFDRSGLWLLQDGDGLRVVDIAQDSAADRAGIRVGDHVAAIDGEPVSSRSLTDWRQCLRKLPVGTALAIDLTRGGRNIAIDLVMADRIPARWIPAAK